MNQQQRRRAQRLRIKRDGDATHAPRLLTAKEATWLAWYEANVGPSPLQPKKVEELEDLPPDQEPEPEIPSEVVEELEEPDELEPMRPLRYVDNNDERRRAELAPFVAKIHALECTNEALRSAVNVQIAGGQMLERACVIALELAELMKQERGGLVQQLVDTIAALAEVQLQQPEEPEPEKKKKGGGITSKGVTEELVKKMIDHTFPPKGENVTTPKDAPTT